MSKLQVVKAASDWNHEFLSSVGMGFEKVHEFKDFFGIDPPEEFGVGLRSNFKNLVSKYVESTCKIGLFNNDNVAVAMDAQPFYHTVMNFFQAENNVVTIYPREESCVDEFGKAVLNLLGFNLIPGINIHGPTGLSTKVGGNKVTANPDIVVTRANPSIILIVQEDKSLLSNLEWQDGASQLMAEALATYDYNRLNGAPDDQDIYGILLRGTVPMFFKINVEYDNIKQIKNTKTEIEDSLIIGKYYCPHNQPNDVFYIRKAPDNLRKFLQCFEAMRRMAIPV